MTEYGSFTIGRNKYGYWASPTESEGQQYLHSNGVIRPTTIGLDGEPTGYFVTEDSFIGTLSKYYSRAILIQTKPYKL